LGGPSCEGIGGVVEVLGSRDDDKYSWDHHHHHFQLEVGDGAVNYVVESEIDEQGDL